MELTPRDLGLPHDTWYPNQEEAAAWALSGKGVKIMEAPTGSGKTGVAAVLAHNRSVLALVRTKFLQQTNYDEGYGFDPLYGRVNYTCDLHGGTATADDCTHKDNMWHCEQAAVCGYLQARDTAQKSNRSVLNYAYWLNVHTSWDNYDVMVCDEAHQLSDITLEWAGLSINERTRQKYDLPTFQIIGAESNAVTSRTGDYRSNRSRALQYVKAARVSLARQLKDAELKADRDPYERKRATVIARFLNKIDSTISALSVTDEGWYIRSGPNVAREGWGFIAKPLTARHHFPKAFLKDGKSQMIMSATIGNPEVFAAELGIPLFDFYQVPSSWEPETRPIHALDAPSIGQKSTQAAYEKQADVIAEAILSCDPSWSGIIHTTSIAEAGKIARRLHSRGLEDRVICLKREPTNSMVWKWRSHLKRRPNSILVSWALWEGYDGTVEKINIAAKTPYPFMGSSYEKQRRTYDGKFFLQRTAWTLEQALGRTRRGRAEDYDTDGETRGFVGIADSNWKRVQKYLSHSTMEAIV